MQLNIHAGHRVKECINQAQNGVNSPHKEAAHTHMYTNHTHARMHASHTHRPYILHTDHTYYTHTYTLCKVIRPGFLQMRYLCTITMQWLTHIVINVEDTAMMIHFKDTAREEKNISMQSLVHNYDDSPSFRMVIVSYCSETLTRVWSSISYGNSR